jgi:hypothetical protein
MKPLILLLAVLAITITPVIADDTFLISTVIIPSWTVIDYGASNYTLYNYSIDPR